MFQNMYGAQWQLMMAASTFLPDDVLSHQICPPRHDRNENIAVNCTAQLWIRLNSRQVERAASSGNASLDVTGHLRPEMHRRFNLRWPWMACRNPF